MVLGLPLWSTRSPFSSNALVNILVFVSILALCP